MKNISDPDVPFMQTHKANILAIASGKGGVGKTWFASTLAHALSNNGNRVLLYDGDLGLANLDIQLGLAPKFDLGSVIAGKLTLAQAITQFKVGNFDVIAGRSGSGTLANLPSSRHRALANELLQLSSQYEYVILDLGAGIDKSVRQTAIHAKNIIVLCTDEPTSLTDAYAFIKVTNTEQPETKIHVVINSVNSNREGERTFNTLSKACYGFLRFKPVLLGIIRRDPKVRETIRAQVPLLTRYPNCEAASDVEAIAINLHELLINRKNVDEKHTTTASINTQS